MPRLGQIVRINEHRRPNDPPVGTYGRVVQVVAGQEDNPLVAVGVDFGASYPTEDSGNLIDIDRILPAYSGRNIRAEALDETDLPSQNRYHAVNDLIGVRVDAQPRYSTRLPAREAEIVTHNVSDMSHIVRFGYLAEGFNDGNWLDGHLPRNDARGFKRVNRDGIVIRTDSPVCVGMIVVLMRDYGSARRGMTGVVVRTQRMLDEHVGDAVYVQMDAPFDPAQGHNEYVGVPAGMGYWIEPSNLRPVPGQSLQSVIDRQLSTPAIVSLALGAYTPHWPTPYAAQPAQAPEPPRVMQVDDLVQTVGALGMGKPAGMIGIVRTLTDGSAGIEFFDPAFSGHHLSGALAQPRGWIVGRIANGRSNSEIQFYDIDNMPIGTQVRVRDGVAPTAPFGSCPEAGTVGRVHGRVDRNAGYGHDVGTIYAIDFGEQRLGFHRCTDCGEERLPNQTGYNLPSSYLEPLSGPVQQAAPEVVVIQPGQTYDWAPAAIPSRPRTVNMAAGALFQAPPAFVPPRQRAPSAAGSPCEVVDVDHELRARGLRPGSSGTVVEDSGGDKIVVDFYPSQVVSNYSGSRGHRKHCVVLHRRFVRIAHDVLGGREMPKLSKGDRVSVLMGGGGLPPTGTEGTVHEVMSGGGEVAVDFYPYRWKYGQDIGTGNDRSGTHVNVRFLELVKTLEDEVPLKPYYLVKLVDGKPVPIEGQPTFDSGQEASDVAKRLTVEMGTKIQVRKNTQADKNWRDREAKRLTDGTYKRLPKAWDLKPIQDHFVHLSAVTPGQVAYTPSPEYGEQDRQVSARPGAYVKKFYPDLDPLQIERYSALATCDGGLELITDADEMVRIYRLGEQGLGPDSCMKYDFVHHGHNGPKTPIHPIATYAAGDIALACLRQDGAIIARCLVWPERRLFTRGYGDLVKIYAILEAEGYKRGNFYDARLVRRTFNYDGQTYYVVPYVDESTSVQGAPGALAVVDDGEYLRIKPEGEGQSTQTAAGSIRIAKQYRLKEIAGLVKCERRGCGSLVDPDERGRVVTGRRGGELVFQNWCRKCLVERSYRCEGLMERVDRNVRRVTIDGFGGASMLYLEAQDGWGLCTLSGYGFVAGADTVPVRGGGRALRKFVKDHAYTCNGTGEIWAKSLDIEPVTINGKTYHPDYAAAHPELRQGEGMREAERRRKQMERSEKKKTASGTMTLAEKIKRLAQQADQEPQPMPGENFRDYQERVQEHRDRVAARADVAAAERALADVTGFRIDDDPF